VGFGVGAFVGPPVANALLQWYTWESVYLILAIPLAGLFVLAAVLFRDDPAAIGARPDGDAAGLSPPSGRVRQYC
jgi:nitrate/nitrite transporter NarK